MTHLSFIALHCIALSRKTLESREMSESHAICPIIPSHLCIITTLTQAWASEQRNQATHVHFPTRLMIPLLPLISTLQCGVRGGIQGSNWDNAITGQ